MAGNKRIFESGATRDTDAGKLDYEGFLSPLVLERYAQYLHQHRYTADGSLRAGDNWQLGMPLNAYIKSALRHFMDWWLIHRNWRKATHDLQGDIEDALCGVIFNAMGYLHEYLQYKTHPPAYQKLPPLSKRLN